MWRLAQTAHAIKRGMSFPYVARECAMTNDIAYCVSVMAAGVLSAVLTVIIIFLL
jgi:hypothetical protein